YSTIVRSYGCLAFFFQAEDGIRDFHVTGVQTCALPISSAPVRLGEHPPARVHPDDGIARARPGDFRARDHIAVPVPDGRFEPDQIGRASCRESAEMLGGGGSLIRNKTRARVVYTREPTV